MLMHCSSSQRTPSTGVPSQLCAVWIPGFEVTNSETAGVGGAVFCVEPSGEKP